jgi:putative oxidoreductase
MNKMIKKTMSHNGLAHELGHTIIRIGVGIAFLTLGYGKLTSGTEHLTQIGSAMAAFGITGGYLLWGLLAGLTEFCGGIAYITGLGTRLVSLPLAWLLIVALTFHMHRGDPFSTWGFAFVCLCITIGLLIAGGGKCSLDYAITRRHAEQ